MSDIDTTPTETVNVIHIRSGALKWTKRVLVSLLVTTSASLTIVMMCLIGHDDSGGAVPGPVFFELIGWAVLSLAVAIALQLWIPDR
jgi:hypothetical protein